MVDLDRLEGLLALAARRRRTVTYGELLAFFERRVTRITVAALCRDLGRLEERREGRPELACLVVRKADGLPGEGYFASLREEGGYEGPAEGPAARAVLRARQEAAFAWAAAAAGAAGDAAAPPAAPAATLRSTRSARPPRAARRRA